MPVNKPPFLTGVRPGATPSDPTRVYQTAWMQPLGRYAATSVVVEHPISPVVTTDLASSAVRRSIAESLRQPLLDANPQLATIPAVQTWAKGSGHRGRRLAASHAKMPTAMHLQHAATVVSLERIVGGFAIRTMERCMGIDYPTAKRWMRILRRMGYIS